MYQPRTYRRWVKGDDLVAFSVIAKETDLYIRSGLDLSSEALRSLLKYRMLLENYIDHHPLFLTTLLPSPIERDAPDIVKEMAESARIAGVGPMAAVAGAIAEAVGRDLIVFSPEIIVENGGDIFLKISKRRLVGIYAGDSPLTGRIALEIEPEATPLGVCTSSGTIGHSLSFGRADAVIVLSPSTPLADAAATAIGNHVKCIKDIQQALNLAQSIENLRGVAIIVDDKIGLWGEIKLSPISVPED